MANKVYDDKQQVDKPGQHDDLGVSPDERKAEVARLNKQFASADAVKTKDIKAAEEEAAEEDSITTTEQQQIDQLGKGYGEESERFAKTKNILRRVSGSRRRNIIGGGVLGGGLIGLLLMLFLALPLKVQHIVNNLQSTFFAAAEQATEDMTDNLFKHYVVKQLVPGMVQNNCTSTRINRSCVNTSTSNNIIGVLYNGWRDGRLEQRLANDGIEIRREGSQFYLKTPSTPNGSPGESLGNFNPDNPDAFNQSAFQKLNRSDLRAEVKKSLKQNTKWDRVMYRYKVGRLMERKYGVKRCIIACAPRDRFTDNVEDKKLAFKAYFLERVIEPRNEMMGLVMQCAIASFTCVEERDANERGERLSQIELDMQAKLAEFRDKYGQRKLDELGVEANRVRQMGALEYMIEKVAGPMVSKTLGKAIPIVGWLDMAAMFIEGAQNVGPAIVKLTYVTNAATMASTYAMYRTNADEIKTGDVDMTAVGSIATSLNPTDGVERKDQNGVGAEASPLYGAIMGGKTRTVTFNPFSQKAYAAASYGCEDDDGNAPRDGKLVCGVERLDNKTAVGTVASAISDKFTNNPAGFAGGVFVDVWNATVGKGLDWLEDIIAPAIRKVIDLLPGDPLERMAAFIRPIIEQMMTFVIKPVISDSPSGARMFNLAAGGADVIGSEFTHYNLGGAKISDAEAFAIRQERQSEQLQEFNSRSMFARMFSTDTQYSLVSQLALAAPASSSSGLVQSMFATISNPLSTAGASLFGFGSGHASAAPGFTTDPFGVVQYGYAKNDKVFTQDPELTWEQEDCDNPDKNKIWGDRALNNPENEMPEHAAGDVNRCLLISAGAGSGGAMFTDDVLPADELGTEEPEAPTEPSDSLLRVSSFNIFHSDDQAPEVWKARLARSVDVLKKNDVEVAGLQEVRPNQIQEFLKNDVAGDVYDMYPKALSNPEFSPNPIIWKKSQFTVVRTGGIPFTYFDGVRDMAPLVKLRDAGGQEFYIINTHDPADTRGEADKTRYDNAQDYYRELQQLNQEGLPIFFTGDFNSGYSLRQGNNNTYQNRRENLTYCILTQGNPQILWDAYDAAADKSGACPTSTGLNDVDHIFLSKRLAVQRYFTAPAGVQNNGSDAHRTIMADVVMGAGVSGEMKDDFKAECASYGVDCGGECVDFVKFRLKKHIDRNKFDSIGNGKDVASGLGATYGYRVDNRPAVNAVVSWPAGGVVGSSANATYGHVAMVSQVKADGSIVVEEYNYANSYAYGTRTIPASVVPRLTYAHTEVDYR